MFGRVERASAQGALQPEAEKRHRRVDRLLQGLGAALGHITGILALRESCNGHLDRMGLLPLVEPGRSTLPGRVGVERQHDPARVALEQAHVFFVNAVPQVATARATPARWNPITSV